MKAFAFLAAAAVLSAAPVYGACTYPKTPDKLPDGNVATKEEMIAGQKAVKQYDADIKAYTDCIKAEHDAAMARDAATLTPEQKEERERIQVQKHNAAVDELTALAERFNEQIRIYNAKRAEAKK